MRYRYDAFGWFIGEVETDEVLPFTSSVKPPEVTDLNKKANYIGNDWVILNYSPNPVIIYELKEQPVDPAEWYLDPGAFKDRFGIYKLAVFSSQDIIIQAFQKDLEGRHWVDLKLDSIKAAVSYMAGIEVPGIGLISNPIIPVEMVSTILNTKPTPDEQFVLRKNLFN